MRLSLNWLSHLVDLEGLKEEEIITKTIKAGFEVEGVEHLGDASGLVVGEVKECHDHPDSDHLHITKVDVGDEILDIVCGAPNCRKGIKVICAKVGAKLPEIEIKASKIRGVESNGMLCSLLELGVSANLLSDDSPSLNGIEELGDEFKVGDTDILKRLGYKDTILDIGLTANRSDALAMHAMAKEMAAILDRPCHLPEYDNKSDIGEKGNFTLVSKSANCPHFLAKVVNHVTIKPSPFWIKEFLTSSGVKSINNVIDISNLVMLETGQPMHFYDIRTNENREITVIDDYEGEYEALDGVTYKIQKGDLMITSDNKPAGIAGIMGGENTKILDDTPGIIIECALFDHARVRQSANRLGLQTEAALRFAKGLDPLAQKKAMDRAVELLIEYADASGFEETVEWGKSAYEPYTVSESITHLNAVIGKEYSLDEVVDVFRRLDFKPEVKGDVITCHIPSYRTNDIKIAEDLDEEVIRLLGYDNLEATLPLMEATCGELTPHQSLRRKVREILRAQGLNETISYTLVDERKKNDTFYSYGEAIALSSPLSDDRKYIRTGLLNSLLETLNYNRDHDNKDVALFEISAVYAKDKAPTERLAVILNGVKERSKLLKYEVTSDFYVLKGIFELMMSELGFEYGRYTIDANEDDTLHLHPYQSAKITFEGKTLGYLGKLHPALLEGSKLSDVFYLEIDLELLSKAKGSKTKAPLINRFPSISRDIAIIVKEDVKALDLKKQIKKAGGKLLSKIEVFDVYRGEHIKKGYKSIALSLTYESFDKTLSVQEVEPLHAKVLDMLNKEYDANLRK